MKKLLLVLVTAVFFAACDSNTHPKGIEMQSTIQDQKVLVAYFSATGTTKQVAENLAKVTGADIYEIKPSVPYTDADLDWRNSKSRTSVEMNNKTSRPEMLGDDFSVEGYDTVFLGFPIWWGTAPHIIATFLEKQDFSNKTIILFATSGSSGLGNSDKDLKPSVSTNTTIIKGNVLNGNPSVEELQAWIETLK